MSNFIIDPKNISPDSIVADLKAFIESKPDSEAWSDFFSGSAGTTIVELVGGLGGFLAYQTIIARREAFLRYAENRSSLIGHAQNKGYSIYRGLNPRIKVTLIPTSTFTLNKFDVLGSVKDSDLILLTPTAFVAGTPVTFLCTLGGVGTETVTYAGGSGPAYFRFKQPKVSEDIELYLNNVVVATSKRLIDAESGKFVTQSNVVGSVDVFFLNAPENAVRLATGDQIVIKYVQYYSTSFLASDVKLDFDGVQTVEVTQRIITPENNSSIALNAPLYSETQYVVRAREDYTKILKLLNPSIIEAGHKNLSPMVVGMLYLKDDLTLLTVTEKEELLAQLLINRNMGLEPPTFIEPVRCPITLVCNVKYVSLEIGLDMAIASIAQEYAKKFSKKIDFEALENSIEDLAGVKIARIEVGTTPWTANTSIQIGQHVRTSTTSNLVYKCESLVDPIFNSGTTEPVWPKLNGKTPEELKGATIEDGGILWQACPLTGAPVVWTAAAPVIKGVAVIASDTTVSDTVGLMFQAISYLGKTGTTQPVFGLEVGDQVTENNLVWATVDKSLSPAKLKRDEYYIIKTQVNLSSGIA